jgi:hypothetical protein
MKRQLSSGSRSASAPRRPTALREIEHRSRSEVFQEALRRYFGAPVYEPTDEERRLLDEALADHDRDPEGGRPWAAVRDELLAE